MHFSGIPRQGENPLRVGQVAYSARQDTFLSCGMPGRMMEKKARTITTYYTECRQRL